jgi:DNA mismatch repair protein MutL
MTAAAWGGRRPPGLDRHATSKSPASTTLKRIATSASVARRCDRRRSGPVELTTAETPGGRGWRLKGRVRWPGPAPGRAVPRLSSVALLQRPRPAQFLKTPQTELRRCLDVIEGYALTRSEVRFRVLHEGRELLDALPSSGEGGTRERIGRIFGGAFAAQLAELPAGQYLGERPGERIGGFVGRPERPPAGGGLHFRQRAADPRPRRPRHLLPRGAGRVEREGVPGPLPLLADPAGGRRRQRPSAEGRRSASATPASSTGSTTRCGSGSKGEGRGGRSAADPGRRARGPPSPGGIRREPAFLACRSLRYGIPWNPGPLADGRDGDLSTHATGLPSRVAAPSYAPIERSVIPLSGRSGEARPFRLLGQYKGTLLLLEGPDGLYLIDQHVAHERLLYERLRRSLLASDPPVQHFFPSSGAGERRRLRLLELAPPLADHGLDLAGSGQHPGPDSVLPCSGPARRRLPSWRPTGE